VADYARVITSKVKDSCSRLGLALPHLTVEPGRAIVAQAGVALYRVGAIKEIPGIRKYVCVDGGMSDNIRPALYDAKYEALVANKVNDIENDIVTIAGKLCESGDILAWNAKLASISSGDLIAMPVCGAYSISMSSNYNSMPRPAIVLLNKGLARIIRKRESYKDLIRLDVV
jgi:diaminopimelate decarboxylase